MVFKLQFAHCTLWFNHCILRFVHYCLYIAHYGLHIRVCIYWFAHCALQFLHCTLQFAHCWLGFADCTMRFAHYGLCIKWHMKHNVVRRQASKEASEKLVVNLKRLFWPKIPSVCLLCLFTSIYLEKFEGFFCPKIYILSIKFHINLIYLTQRILKKVNFLRLFGLHCKKNAGLNTF